MKKDGFFKTGNVKWQTVTIIVLIALVFSVGIVTFAQPLADNLFNTANKGNSTDWNISFTKAVQRNITGNAKEVKPVSYTATTASFAVELTGTGDSVTYDFTITNNGRLDAEVESIYIVPTNKEDDVILFQTSNLKVGDELLAGERKDIRVTASFNSNFSGETDGLQKSATVIINFVQKE